MSNQRTGTSERVETIDGEEVVIRSSVLPMVSVWEIDTMGAGEARRVSARRVAADTGLTGSACPVCGHAHRAGDDTVVRSGAVFCAHHRSAPRPVPAPHDIGCASQSGDACDCSMRRS